MLFADGAEEMRAVLSGAGDAGVAATAGVSDSHVRPQVPPHVLPQVLPPRKAGEPPTSPVVATRLVLSADGAEEMRGVSVVMGQRFAINATRRRTGGGV